MGMDSILLTAMVAGLCSNTGRNEALLFEDNSRACRMGIEATVRQVGIYENVRQWEKKQKKQIEEKAKKYIQDKEGKIVASGIVLISMGLGNKSMFKLGRGPLSGNYYLEASFRELNLGVGWDF